MGLTPRFSVVCSERGEHHGEPHSLRICMPETAQLLRSPVTVLEANVRQEHFLGFPMEVAVQCNDPCPQKHSYNKANSKIYKIVSYLVPQSVWGNFKKTHLILNIVYMNV